MLFPFTYIYILERLLYSNTLNIILLYIFFLIFIVLCFIFRTLIDVKYFF